MTKSHILKVPIYDQKVWVVICDDVLSERIKKAWVKRFGVLTNEPAEYWGMVARNGRGQFGLFLKRGKVTHELVAHEVFHLTVRILEFVGSEIEPDNHEHCALLHGWLVQRVWELIKK